MISLIPFLKLSREVQEQTRSWRNQENVAQFFKITHIDEKTHAGWLNTLKEENPKNIAFVIQYDTDFVGVTYFHSIDYKKKCADWGIYIHKDSLRGKGIGYYALSECIYMAREKFNFSVLYLDVLETNLRAIKLYQNCGFEIIGKEGDFLRCRLDLVQKAGGTECLSAPAARN